MSAHPCAAGHKSEHHKTGSKLVRDCPYGRRYLGIQDGKHTWETKAQARKRGDKLTKKRKKTMPDYREVLNCLLLEHNSAGAKTVGDYLSKLVIRVLQEAEGFSGKRPFGDSDWYWELVTPVSERFGVNEEDAASLIVGATESLFGGVAA